MRVKIVLINHAKKKKRERGEKERTVTHTLPYFLYKASLASVYHKGGRVVPGPGFLYLFVTVKVTLQK